MPRARLLYYCQSLVGIGHLSCSLRIAQALREHVDIDFIHGGLDNGPLAQAPDLRTLRLPTLLHDEDGGDFIDPAGGSDLDTVWSARAAAIAAFLRPPYRGVVLEFWPFGRRRFKSEIMAMLAAVQAGSGPVPVFSSVREVLVPRPPETERRMVRSVQRHVHTVYVRGDPRIVTLEDTFTLAPEIADRVVYTGYVGQPAMAVQPAPARGPQVLASVGGGNVGRELLQAVIATAALLPDRPFVVVAGAATPPHEVAALRDAARSPNVEVVPFLSDFPRHLRAAAASINMGGDNTLVDVLQAGTPSLAYPYARNPEQGLRIARFAARGLVHALSPDDLAPERLRDRLLHALQAPRPDFDIAADGARVTAEHIAATLAAPA